MNYSGIIAMEPGKRSGKAVRPWLAHYCLRCTGDLASGMTNAEILQEFPYLTEQDIRACLAFAADRERKLEMLHA
jgi:uncharacterized protein (DUF433 family)